MSQEVVLGNTRNEESFDAVRPLADTWSFHDNNVKQGESPRLVSSSGNYKQLGDGAVTKRLHSVVLRRLAVFINLRPPTSRKTSKAPVCLNCIKYHV